MDSVWQLENNRQIAASDDLSAIVESAIGGDMVCVLDGRCKPTHTKQPAIVLLYWR